MSAPTHMEVETPERSFVAPTQMQAPLDEKASQAHALAETRRLALAEFKKLVKKRKREDVKETKPKKQAKKEEAKTQRRANVQVVLVPEGQPTPSPWKGRPQTNNSTPSQPWMDSVQMDICFERGNLSSWESIADISGGTLTGVVF